MERSLQYNLATPAPVVRRVWVAIQVTPVGSVVVEAGLPG